MSLQDKMNVSAKPALKSLKTEVANELGISKPYAYKLLREMNEELKQKGFITIPGRVSRRYFEEKFYGLRDRQ